jgi:hypothetical protein
MKKLHVLSLWNLPIAAHFDYFNKLRGWISQQPASVQAALAVLLPDLQLWLAREEEVMRWVRKSLLTEKIAEADRRVDHVLQGIGAVVKAALYSLNPTVAEAAHRVHLMLKRYGRVAHKPYDDEAGDVRTLLLQFAGDYAADVATLLLPDWVQELQAAFDEFEVLLRQREDRDETRPAFSAREVRKALDAVYEQMTILLEAGSASSDAAADFTAFIDYLNPDIDRLNSEFKPAKKDLAAGDHTVIEPIADQQYTGEQVTPLPAVLYRAEGKPTVKLVFATDYTVTYKNNVNVGMAELTIHGKGAYRGQKTVAFMIAR